MREGERAGGPELRRVWGDGGRAGMGERGESGEGVGEGMGAGGGGRGVSACMLLRGGCLRGVRKGVATLSVNCPANCI